MRAPYRRQLRSDTVEVSLDEAPAERRQIPSPARHALILGHPMALAICRRGDADVFGEGSPQRIHAGEAAFVGDATEHCHAGQALGH